MRNVKLNKIITIEAGKRQSKPCIRGMRISVNDVISWLNIGMTPEEIIIDFPELNKRDIAACSQFARDWQEKHLRHRL
ncbi:MAG: DUF433 domain-containing protein [Bacteroidia bacterium]|nr:DUF433 domain-containing protein [Bacteroidia bacterium]